MPADPYYKMLSKKQSGGTTHIEMEEVIPFGKKKKWRLARMDRFCEGSLAAA